MDFEIDVFQGAFEDNLSEIRSRCSGFTFTFIDPTGWNLRSQEIADFLSVVKGDFLLNFMEHPISRHNSYARVRDSFGRFLAEPRWFEKLDVVEGNDARVQSIIELLKRRLRELGAARYLPDFPIIQPRTSRVQMRLVLGTHHPDGVEVFRDVQHKLESEYLMIRRSKRDGHKQSSLFSDEQLNEIELGGRGIGGEKSIAEAREAFRLLVSEMKRPTEFFDLAVRIMEKIPVRLTNMKDIAVQLRKEGFLDYPTKPRVTKPRKDSPIRRAAS